MRRDDDSKLVNEFARAFVRLSLFRQLGERAYSDMYDVIAYSASGYYSDAKAAFHHDAILTARDLKRVEEVRALQERLTQIQKILRSQFK